MIKNATGHRTVTYNTTLKVAMCRNQQTELDWWRQHKQRQTQKANSKAPKYNNEQYSVLYFPAELTATQNQIPPHITSINIDGQSPK